MSKRSDRREADRLARKAAFQQLRQQPAIAEKISEVPELAATELDSGLLARAQAFFDHPFDAAAEVRKHVSAAQFAANRANAQLSTGPTSEAGKVISSRNHLSHGLTINLETRNGPFQVLPNEDQADFDAGLALFTAEWKPATATEQNLVERLAIHTWLTRRAGRLIDQLLIEGGGRLRYEDIRSFDTFSRYQTTHQRAFNKAFADLMRLKNFQRREAKEQQQLEQHAQDAIAKEQIRFESQKRKAEEHAIKLETFKLKLEAQKHRNQRLIKTQTNPVTQQETPQTDIPKQLASTRP